MQVLNRGYEFHHGSAPASAVLGEYVEQEEGKPAEEKQHDHDSNHRSQPHFFTQRVVLKNPRFNRVKNRDVWCYDDGSGNEEDDDAQKYDVDLAPVEFFQDVNE